MAEDGEADGRLRVLDLRSDGEVERTAGRSLGSTVGMALSLNLSSLSTLTSSTFGSLHSPGSKSQFCSFQLVAKRDRYPCGPN